MEKEVEIVQESKLLTGSRDLNLWLEGGYEKGIVTLFYGPAASGKSNFMMLAACSLAKKDKKVLFVDTEGSFSVDRIKQIAGELYSEILSNIIILKPISFEEQKKAFLKLEKEFKSNNVGLVIVDSICMFYRLELAEARKRGKESVRIINSDLAKQMSSLYELARKKEIPILVTSQIYNDFLSEEDWLKGKQAGVNIVGGDILRYWSKCMIELQCRYGRKRAILKKHRSLPERDLNFDIIDKGIVRRGWL